MTKKGTSDYVNNFFTELVSPARLASGIIVAFFSLGMWILSSKEQTANIEAKLDKYIALNEQQTSYFKEEIKEIKVHLNIASNVPAQTNQLSFNQSYAVQPHEVKMEVDEQNQ